MNQTGRKYLGRALRRGNAQILALGLAGCQLAGSAEQSAITSADAPDASTKGLLEPAATIVGYQAKGDLCPGAAEDWKVVGSSFKLLTRKLEPSSRGQHASCTLNLQIQVTAGQRFGNPLINYDGYTIGHAHLITNYTFKDGQSAGPIGRYLVAKEGAFSETFSDLWAPACEPTTATRVVEFTVELQVRVAANEGFELADISGDFSSANGVTWLRCGDTPKVSTPGAQEGEPCSLLPKVACRDELTCDLIDDDMSPDTELNDGTCVDPHRVLAPQGKGQNCGGARDVSCDAGLVCHFSSASRAAQHAVGTCVASTAIEDQPCGGFPAVACGAGLSCAADSQLDRGTYCQSPRAKLGELCASGLPACATGLSCHNGACAASSSQPGNTQVPGNMQTPVGTQTPTSTNPSSNTQMPATTQTPASTQTPTTTTKPSTTTKQPAASQPATVAGQGEACGGSSTASCAAPLVCDLKQLVCVSGSTAGTAGASCVSSSDCGSGLLCIGAACAKPVTDAPAGSLCHSTLDCQAGLTCSRERCVVATDLGAVCAQSDDCSDGLICSQQRCVVDQFDGSLGAPCNDASDCDPGLACLSSQCQSTSRTGSATVLQP